MSKKKDCGFAVVGAGGRLTELTKLFGCEQGIRLIGAWDPEPAALSKIIKSVDAWAARAKKYANYEELLADQDVDWVFVGSPNCYHAGQILQAFAAGKHVFAEKPLALTVEDCLAIREAHHTSKRLFATGFTLRYSPLYRKAKQLVASGLIGKLISIDANENLSPGHGTYIMSNWRRHIEISGPNVLEKCCHDLDILNWICDSLPVKVAAFGGTDIFVPENAELYETSSMFHEWDYLRHDDVNPFTSDKSIEDNLVTILQYANGVRAQFMLTMCNPIAERRMFISGSKGTIILDLVKSNLIVRTLTDEAQREYVGLGKNHGHAGGDEVMTAELSKVMRGEGEIVCGGDEGLRSAVVAIAIEKARREDTIVRLDEVWKSLGVSF